MNNLVAGTHEVATTFNVDHQLVVDEWDMKKYLFSEEHYQLMGDG